MPGRRGSRHIRVTVPGADFDDPEVPCLLRIGDDAGPTKRQGLCLPLGAAPLKGPEARAAPRGRQKFEINSEGNEAGRVSLLGCALKRAEPPQFPHHLCADALQTPKLLVANAPQIAERPYGSRLSVLQMPEASGPTLDVRVAQN